MVVNVPISSTRTWIVWGYVGLENDDAATAIDTVENMVIAIIPLGQAPQGVAYVPEAVPNGEGRDNLQSLDPAVRSRLITASPNRMTSRRRRHRPPSWE